MITKIAGNTITHKWPLNVAAPHEMQAERIGWGPGDDVAVYDLTAPTAGYCWVVQSLTWSYDIQPTFPAIIWIDGLGGAVMWWITIIGQTWAKFGMATNMGPYKFIFDPALKFPVDQDIAFNYWGGDPITRYEFSCECWEEAQSISP